MNAAARLGELERDRFLAQADQIAQLVKQPAWLGWMELLKTMRTAALEELAKCGDPGDFRYWQGAAAALQQIMERPEQMCALAGQVAGDEEEEQGLLRPELRSIVGFGVDRESDI